MQKLSALEQFAGSLAASLRQELKPLESLPGFCFDLRIEGRVHSGDLRVEFRIGENQYAQDVKAGTYRAMIEEFMRRHGWDKANRPLMIGYDATIQQDKDLLPNA